MKWTADQSGKFIFDENGETVCNIAPHAFGPKTGDVLADKNRAIILAAPAALALLGRMLSVVVSGNAQEAIGILAEINSMLKGIEEVME